MGPFEIQRTLYKHALGHQICFEEVNHDLGLRFSYSWQTSECFGFVRKVRLTNEGKRTRTARVLDGLRNVLPHGTSLKLQSERSTLLDAYKRNEFIGRVGMYSLSSHVVDRPEPAESLQCTTVWSVGPEDCTRLLCERQVRAFRRGRSVCAEHDVRAERGAYLVAFDITLAPGEEVCWTFAAELDQGFAEVAALSYRLDGAPSKLLREVAHSVARGTQNLQRVIGLSDGFQCSDMPQINVRHTANTLFNVMRGGTCLDQYHITRADVVQFVRTRNKALATSIEEIIPTQLTLDTLHEATRHEVELRRLCLEYLPLTFSRRHGDPSRPWNRFNINVRNADGSKRLDFEGNWRDIFQNWEALALSYPALVTGMICTFVNASTADGYNPYRITRNGIDWEVPDPQDPWAHIGYWGDHQTVYLLRLLLIAQSHFPELLPALLHEHAFAYANVPYRIKPYGAVVADPHNTITFDAALAARIGTRVRKVGTDGKLVWNDADQVHLVTLAEKLLVSLCTRLSNFVPGVGIWMNTQRPEWNDANNALVGWGISVVTLCYLRPLLAFCADLFEMRETTAVAMSTGVATWLEAVSLALSSGLAPRPLMDALGKAGSDYRQNYYMQGFTGEVREVALKDLRVFFASALRHVDAAIASNRRADGLYHAYNLLSPVGTDTFAIDRLSLMLEGQVAALSSGNVSVLEAIRVLQVLRKSALWREDQRSYLLYPDRPLPAFTDKCTIPQSLVERSPLLLHLIEAGDFSIAGKTPTGVYYFNASFRNRDSVAAALDALASAGYRDDVIRERQTILGIFESVFSHKTFTGRSGTFFKYEGLGSIYWHMVSKLLLSVQEVYYRGLDQHENAGTLAELAALYYELRAGIGDHKTPAEYGAFPTDPYSHTPAHAGAQQPGMTGQVKEDIIGRWNELGVRVKRGCVTFSGALIRRSEFLRVSTPFSYYTVQGERATEMLPANTLGFTYIQVPIVYHAAAHPALRIQYASGEEKQQATLALSAADSCSVFDRTGNISKIEVFLAPECM